MTAPLINRSALLPGDWIVRRCAPFYPSKMIRLVTAGKNLFDDPPTAWNHDAIICDDHGHPAIGDALMGRNGQLTTIYEWEMDCVRNGTKIMVLRPAGATPEDGLAAATWWLDHVHGHKYDTVSIAGIFFKRLLPFLPEIDVNGHYYCSEGNGSAWKNGPRTPFHIYGIERGTPGASWRAWGLNRLVEVMEAYTPEGMGYRIAQPARPAVAGDDF